MKEGMELDGEKVIVVDSIMGSGKTSWAIQNITEQINENILYITPLLDEAERIKSSCTTRDFKLPRPLGGGKLANMKDLLRRQEDIASTHALFQMFDAECKDIIASGDYVLYIDETVEAVSPFDLTHSGDIDYLIGKGSIAIREDGAIEWCDTDELDTSYNVIRTLAQNHSLFLVNGKMLIWQYPAEIFSLFKKVYVLTYRFSGCILKNYFDMNGIRYKVCSVGNSGGRYCLQDHYEPSHESIRGLLHLYDGNDLNDQRQKRNVLSVSWCQNSSKQTLQAIKNNIYNYLHNKVKAKSDEIMWSCFEDYRQHLRGNGYGKKECFVACNCRGTNQYRDRTKLVYAVNKFPHPAVSNFFSSHGLELDGDAYALSEMVQWIWRSAIRDGREVWLYVPSRRMRELLAAWLAE